MYEYALDFVFPTHGLDNARRWNKDGWEPYMAVTIDDRVLVFLRRPK